MFIPHLSLALFSALAFGAATRDPPKPVVDLGYSRFQGTSLSNGITQFLGIPFAAPPLGNLRFRAPQDPLPSKEIRKAEEWGPLCLATLDQLVGGESEDCLHISVFKPTSAKEWSNLPVFVFIQGGGYNALMNAFHNGTELIQNAGNKAIYVHFNYRVGMYGFLASEEVKKDGDLNVGLLDQRFALKWVQKHIRKFGGNPNRVIIQGASAGAGSVAHLLTEYGGRDDKLFHGAIGSSVYFPITPRPEAFYYQYRNLVFFTGCATAKSSLQCLRELPAEVLQKFHVKTVAPGRNGVPLFEYAPVIDGDLIRSSPYEAFASGRFVNVPVIMGHETNEGSYFVPAAESEQDIHDFFQNNYPRLTDEDVRKITKIYTPEKFPPLPGRSSHWGAVEAAFSEATFICPGKFIVDKMPRSWSYHCDAVDQANVEAALGVPHTWCIPAETGLANGGIGTGFETYNRPTVDKTMDYWKSFIQFLEPNLGKNKTAPLWAPWKLGRKRVVLQNDMKLEAEPREERKRCEFWWGMRKHMDL